MAEKKESKEEKRDRESRERQDHSRKVGTLGRSPSDAAHEAIKGSYRPGEALPGEKVASVVAFGESSPYFEELSESEDSDVDSLKSGKRAVSGPDGSDVKSSASEAGVETRTTVQAAKKDQREEQRTDDSEDSVRVSKSGGE